MGELTETDKAIVKGQKAGMAIAIPLAAIFTIAKCAGVDFRSEAQIACEAKGGVWQSPKGAQAVCIKKEFLIDTK